MEFYMKEFYMEDYKSLYNCYFKVTMKNELKHDL